jgi:hypothetical protein
MVDVACRKPYSYDKQRLTPHHNAEVAVQVAKILSPLTESREAFYRLSPFRVWVPYLFLVSAIVVWSLGVPAIDPRAMSDLGLVSALPPTIFVGLLFLTVGFALNLHPIWWSERRLLGHVVALMVMLYGITAFIFETPRFATTWKLIGVTDFVLLNGTVLPRVDAFMNWPGFFIFSAALTEMMGLETPLQYAAWAHLGFNLLYLPPLYLLLTAITADKRLVWTAIWFFYVTNWIGQDYLAPQALGFLFFVTTLAICVRWFRVKVPTPTTPITAWRQWGQSLRVHLLDGWRSGDLAPANPTTTPLQRMALLAIILLMVMALIPTHQLTPFALAGVLLVLVLTNRITLRHLPFIIVILGITWLSFAAILYLQGNIDKFLGPLGQVTSNVARGVNRRVVGSPDHQFVVQLRVVMSVLWWGIASAGLLRRLKHGVVDVTMGILAYTPFALLVLQAYGGELLLRIYFFALPGMAFLAGALFFPTLAPLRSWRTPAALIAVTVLLLAGFQITRYGNERADYFPTTEWQAVEVLYEHANARSLILAVTNDLPWRYREYTEHRYSVVDRYVRDGDLTGLLSEATAQPYEDVFLIVTTGQYAGAQLFLGMEPSQIDMFLGQMEASGAFTPIYRNADAILYQMSDEVVESRTATTGGNAQ